MLSQANTKLGMLSCADIRRSDAYLETKLLDDGSIIPGDRLSLGGGCDTGHLPPGGLLLPLGAHTDVGVLVNIVALPEKAVGESNIISREDMPLAPYYR